MCLNSEPGWRTPLSNPVEVTVWAIESLFIHETVSPTLMVSAPGLNARFFMVTVFACAVPAGPVDCVELFGWVTDGLVRVVVVLPPHPATAISMTAANAHTKTSHLFFIGPPIQLACPFLALEADLGCFLLHLTALTAFLPLSMTSSHRANFRVRVLRDARSASHQMQIPLLEPGLSRPGQQRAT